MEPITGIRKRLVAGGRRGGLLGRLSRFSTQKVLFLSAVPSVVLHEMTHPAAYMKSYLQVSDDFRKYSENRSKQETMYRP